MKNNETKNVYKLYVETLTLPKKKIGKPHSYKRRWVGVSCIQAHSI